MRFRTFTIAIGLLTSVGLASCTTTSGETETAAETTKVQIFSDAYGNVTDAGFALPAIPIQKVDKKFHRQIVSYTTSEKPGTIIVNTRERFLYYILPRGQAVRYGIGVGKQGFSWEGEAYIAWKQAWPTWHPPKEMAERKPEIARYVEKGMDPGLKNPLGARALYLGSSLYRIHGSNEPHTIGQAVSSGCIRMRNEDVIDLYERVGIGTAVI
eukprot:gene5080-6733_t